MVISEDSLCLDVPLEQLAVEVSYPIHGEKINVEEALNHNMHRRKHKFTVHLRNSFAFWGLKQVILNLYSTTSEHAAVSNQ